MVHLVSRVVVKYMASTRQHTEMRDSSLYRAVAAQNGGLSCFTLVCRLLPCCLLRKLNFYLRAVSTPSVVTRHYHTCVYGLYTYTVQTEIFFANSCCDPCNSTLPCEPSSSNAVYYPRVSVYSKFLLNFCKRAQAIEWSRKVPGPLQTTCLTSCILMVNEHLKLD